MIPYAVRYEAFQRLDRGENKSKVSRDLNFERHCLNRWDREDYRVPPEELEAQEEAKEVEEPPKRLNNTLINSKKEFRSRPEGRTYTPRGIIVSCKLRELVTYYKDDAGRTWQWISEWLGYSITWCKRHYYRLKKAVKKAIKKELRLPGYDGPIVNDKPLWAVQ